MGPVVSAKDFRDLWAEGKAARESLPRSAQGVFRPTERDPIAVLEAEHASRIASLVPERVGRMQASPFAFYRGSAAVMAHDLAPEPHTGAPLVVCGDAHLGNFGLYATPERALTFELNDFDEATVGPWEWDVKRFATSLVVGGEDIGLGRTEAAEVVRHAIGVYRDQLDRLGQKTVLERFSHREPLPDASAGHDVEAVVRATVDRAARRSSDAGLARLVDVDADGVPRLVKQPLAAVHEEDASLDLALDLFRAYRRTARADVALLLGQFRLVDVVLRVVGVGSVGTRCYLSLLVGPSGERLLLQTKEAEPSVLETFGGLPPFVETFGADPDRVDAPQGYRVVSAQRVMQSASDAFLGHFRHEGRDYYVRQFRDMKGSVRLDALTPAQFRAHAAQCAALLARAHAQSPNVAFVCGYLGSDTRFDDAMTAWALAYADQVDRDFAALNAAVSSGRLPSSRAS